MFALFMKKCWIIFLIEKGSEQRIIDTKTTVMITWKHQFVTNYQNVWHKILILFEYQRIMRVLDPFLR